VVTLNDHGLKEAVVKALTIAATELPSDVVNALKRAEAAEDSELAKSQLNVILRNVDIAREQSLPICQDTGIQTFSIEAGVDSPYLGQLQAVLTDVVAEATMSIPIRPNTVNPFTGKNPGDNLGRFMPYINWELVEGDEIVMIAFPKGGGSENCCTLKMLLPGVGMKGVKQTVVDHIISCGGRPCPPTVVGVGIGGVVDQTMKMAKRAVLREVGVRHPEPVVAILEEELVELINMSGVGSMGIGGRTTVLDVHVEYAFRHPASLPVAILIQCWADRRARVRIAADGSIEVS